MLCSNVRVREWDAPFSLLRSCGLADLRMRCRRYERIEAAVILTLFRTQSKPFIQVLDSCFDAGQAKAAHPSTVKRSDLRNDLANIASASPTGNLAYSPSAVQHPLLHGTERRAGAGRYAEFLVNVLNMMADRFAGDIQARGHLAIRLSPTKQAQDFDLARR